MLSLSKRYDAERRPDGAFAIRSVPIFAENERSGLLGDTLSFNKKWLVKACRIDRRLRSDGYTVPMHFGHHEPGIDRERAGHVEIRRVGLRRYMGRLRWVLFADLVFPTQEKLDRARAEFPYRSVEISPEKPDEINSLALLSTNAPYFRFPNLSFQAAADGRQTYVWRHSMAEADETKDAPETTPGKPDEAKKFMEDDVSSALMAKMDELMAMFAKYVGADEKDEDEDDTAPEPTKDRQPVVAASADTAKLEGQVAGLKAEVDGLRRHAENDRIYRSLLDELQSYALPNLEAELRKRVENGTANAWAAGIKELAPRTRRNEAPAEPSDPPEVQKYASQGPQALSEARKIAALYLGAPKTHVIRNHSLERYLATQLEEVR